MTVRPNSEAPDENEAPCHRLRVPPPQQKKRFSYNIPLQKNRFAQIETFGWVAPVFRQSNDPAIRGADRGGRYGRPTTAPSSRPPVISTRPPAVRPVSTGTGV